MTQRCGPTGACTEQSSLRAVQWQHLRLPSGTFRGLLKGRQKFLAFFRCPRRAAPAWSTCLAAFSKRL